MSDKYQSRTAQQGFGRRADRGAAVEKPKNRKDSMKRLIAYFRAEMGFVLLLVLLVTLGVAASVVAPGIQSSAIDRIVDGRYETLPVLLAVMLATYLFHSLATLFQGRLSAILSQRVVRKLREDLFRKIIYLPVSYTDRHSHGDLISRMTNDADNISNVISTSLGNLFSGVLTLVGTVAVMLWYNVPLALLSCLAVSLSLLLSTLITRLMRKYYKKRQALLGQLNGTVEEMVVNYRTVAAYNRQETVIEEFTRTADDLTRTGIIAEILGGSMGPIMNMFSNVAFVFVAVFGAWFALKGWITIGVISAFIIYAKQISRPIGELAQLYGQIETALAGAERIFAVLDAQEEPDGGLPAPEPIRGVLEFRNVNFSYVPGNPVIRDFSLTVDSGRKIALVGSTGSGKTTVINLLMRFYEIDSGEILLDGTDIRKLSLSALRDTVGIVLQDTVLFTDTVRANLSYAAENPSEEELDEAARFSNCWEMIRQLPQGYDTMLAEAGGNLSQGQRQLLAIGRAYLSRPSILILDEATSSVDTRTEKHIQDAMTRLMEDRTSLIIAHRLSTIRDADQIVVMDSGRIVEIGTHEELLAQNGKYHELYMTQFEGGAI